ncbi:glycoside hydrolase family 5 protein [Haloplasma contractile]|uniref:Exo-1,3-beta-glucanase D n=1 Tax=Haloplasma contractile SSD-17B TaxID=1033810 RepID=U2FIX5_9MOLU|nr:cellulase family glycosylhydrolase [Haloplasma contractile]ERJ11219.1 glucan 13-beta-glucosidase protein [Haloplasma contractile SSD-17B]
MATIRGINLGGWFVLEKWMKPVLFNGVDGPDETIFCKQAENALETLQEHWNTFITEEDFKYIKEDLELNSIRIPIPWWMFFDTTPYFSGIKYLDKAMAWADQYDLKVLLDLHTAPGCQNGFDNGGITGVIEWDKDTKNIKKTIETLEIIVKRYKNHTSLWGIQVLNEPHWTIDLDLLQTFYKHAYTLIRKHLKDVYIVFHDSFRPDNEGWVSFFKQNAFHNVLFDLHLYQCFGDQFNDMKIREHIEFTLGRLDLIERLNKLVPLIVGEWSLGLHGHVFKGMDQFMKVNALTTYANTQLFTYENCFGWYFWSYKLERNDSLDGWNFKQLVKQGIFPKSYN